MNSTLNITLRLAMGNGKKVIVVRGNGRSFVIIVSCIGRCWIHDSGDDNDMKDFNIMIIYR